MKHFIVQFVTCLSLLFSSTVQAQNYQLPSYNNIYVFGDSLSDNGNLQAFNQNPALPVPERFSNGPVTVEIIAYTLGLTLTPSLHLLPIPSSGNNYAVAGARSSDADDNEASPDINLPTQINAFLLRNAGAAPEDALYIIFSGGNDVRDARNLRTTAVFAETSEQRKAIRHASLEILDKAALSQKTQINKLIAAGAKHILVINSADISVTPETAILTTAALEQANTSAQTRRAKRIPQIARNLSQKFNRKLKRNIRNIERQTSISIIEFDLFKFFTQQIHYADFFGFTNTVAPCLFFFSQAGAINPDCIDAPTATGFLFWDEIHPTTQLHRNGALAILATIIFSHLQN